MIHIDLLLLHFCIDNMNCHYTDVLFSDGIPYTLHKHTENKINQ